jgi:polysaccharide deacetylase family protein (PEP-CTERM system associated)
MLNALSIDLEDWFCACNVGIGVDDWEKCESRVVKNTHRILDLLQRSDTRATFFVLGWVAERAPDLIREVEERGHEVATHGYSHTPLTRMTPEAFEADLRRALAVTQPSAKRPILGFRAPSFTITPKTLWAVDILVRNGVKYDSSIFPIRHHPDYGLPDARLAIHKRGELIEVPMSVAEIFGQRVPCSGGGYFRLTPYMATKFLMQTCNRQGRPVIFYLHPWEIDADQPRVKMTFAKTFRHYTNLDKTLDRMERLLQDFQFTPIREVLGL